MLSVLGAGATDALGAGAVVGGATAAAAIAEYRIEGMMGGAVLGAGAEAGTTEEMCDVFGRGGAGPVRFGRTEPPSSVAFRAFVGTDAEVGFGGGLLISGVSSIEASLDGFAPDILRAGGF